MRPVVADLLGLSPDVIMVFSNLALALLKPMSQGVPIVFVGVGDPIGDGFVESLARPGGNMTGFAGHDGPIYSLNGAPESLMDGGFEMKDCHDAGQVRRGFVQHFEPLPAMVVVEASNNLLQPGPLFGDRLVHPLSQLLLDPLELYTHAVAPGLPLEEKLPTARCATHKDEAQESEGFRFANPALGTPVRREAAKLDQAGLFRM